MDLSWASERTSPRRTVPAGLISVLAHVALFWAITEGAKSLPPEPPLSPLRFAGQTFDVEAVGDGEQEEATRPSDESAPGAEGLPVPPPMPEAKPEPESESPIEESEAERTESVEPDGDSGLTPPVERAPARVVEQNSVESRSKPATQPKPAPKPKPARPTPTPAPQPKPAPKQQPSPVDPFDMALPGESSTDSAVARPSDSGTYGADDDAPVGVTGIHKAFLHMFPEANRHRDDWKALPVGPIGRVEFVIMLGKNARIVSLQIVHDTNPVPPEILVRAVHKTRRSLQFQRLGWEGERRAGAQRLAITAKVMKKSAHRKTPEREGTMRHGRFGEGRPNAAFFTYYDGHHIEIELEKLGTVASKQE